MEGLNRRRAKEEIRDEAAKNGWYVFEREIPLSRGFPKIMRRDFDRIGDAATAFRSFSREFFERLFPGREWGWER